MEIRPVTENDYAIVAALSAESGELHHQGMPQMLTPDPISEKAFHELLANPLYTLLFAVDSGETVGILIYRIDDMPRSDHFYAQRALYVQDVIISQAHQRKGYGEALMNYAVEAAKELGINQITLNVWAFNQSAVAFYEHLGFKPLTVNMMLEW